MKIFRFLLTMLLLPVCLSISGQDTITQDSVITEKLKLAQKLLLANGHERAFQLFTECAAAGNAKAMNAIGLMKQRGWGTDIDEVGSIVWFEQAGAAGYEKAYYNLFKIYSKAIGVEQDFNISVDYLDTLQNLTNRTYALSMLGYHYYKGLGVEQNYETAVTYFLQAAEYNYSDAFYFLGLCYRNGYGVEQDEAEAQYYLSRAAELGHWYSKNELAEEAPEVVPQAQHIAMRGNGNRDTLKTIPREYRKIKRHNLNNQQVTGEYSGAIVMYDYSGKHIVRTSDLKIRFDDSQNGRIFGQWVESDSLAVDFEAILTDSTLQFLNTDYIHTERYFRNTPKKWIFKNAILEKTETDSVSYLAGNIQQYDTKQKEPSKPLYISVQKNKFENASQEKKDFLVTYPNPFESEVNILFTLENEQNVTLSVYLLNGVLFDSKNLGVLPAGKQNILLTLSAPKGEYLLVVQKGNKRVSSLIIKK
ncbi:MAG: T9SS type A sorting domain-containing protein [Prevotellaceae bacterium]|jgi:TPR repeat protein|nr:T9SS type A sorting domain-containing protein [Prevotellaceae bacterium]